MCVNASVNACVLCMNACMNVCECKPKGVRPHVGTAYMRRGSCECVGNPSGDKIVRAWAAEKVLLFITKKQLIGQFAWC